MVDAFAPQVEQLWRSLDEPTSPSFFTSWGWIETWLAMVPRAHAPTLAVVRDGDRPLAAWLMCRTTDVRLKVVRSRALYLNTTGDPRLDELCVEHNGTIGRQLGILELLELLPSDWDEFVFPWLRADAFRGLSELVFRGIRIRIDREVPAYFVDLARVREAGYLKLVGGQTRSQIRRAQRDAGAVEIDHATDVASALEIYTELTALHQRLWRGRGEPGAFADPWFDAFHRRLIAQRFAHGEIELLRLRGRTGTIGALYNFVHRGRVLQYQSGLASFEDRHIKPGFLAHTAAIEHAAAVGHQLYDFLGGDVRYKRSLSTGNTRMVWARAQRLALRFAVEDRVRAFVRARRRAAAAPDVPSSGPDAEP